MRNGKQIPCDILRITAPLIPDLSFWAKKLFFRMKGGKLNQSGLLTDVWRNKKCQNIAVFRLFRNPTHDLRQYLLDAFFTQVKFSTGLSNRQRRPDIPVILCTGYSEIMDEKKAGALGIDAFLYKPIIIEKMLEVIREVLDRKM